MYFAFDGNARSRSETWTVRKHEHGRLCVFASQRAIVVSFLHWLWMSVTHGCPSPGLSLRPWAEDRQTKNVLAARGLPMCFVLKALLSMSKV